MGVMKEEPKPRRKTTSKELYQLDPVTAMPIPEYTRLFDIRTIIDAKIANRGIELTESQRMIYDILFL